MLEREQLGEATLAAIPGRRVGSYVRGTLFGALLLAGALMPAAALAQASGTAVAADAPAAESGALPARLSDVEGSVQIASAAQAAAVVAPGNLPPPPPPDAAFSQATVNMPVLPGTRIETGDNGRAELQFTDGSLARLTPSSSARLDTLTGDGEQVRSLTGLLYYEVPDHSSGQLTVRVGAFTLTPSLNSLIRVDLDARPYAIAALRGTVLVESTSPDVSFTLDEGQAAALDAADPNGYRLLDQVASTSWDQWNADRDDALAQMAEGQTSARDTGGNEDADAWNDLDYYGTWYDVPGVGEAWAPDGVDADFDPYGNGQWDYYNGIGYTWISAYPWGWLPYHCGNWNYFTGFGWMWQPVGGCGLYGGVGWFPYTGISHAPYGYSLPRPVKRLPLRTRLGGAPIGPVQPVRRGSQYRFRAVGGARPEPRPLALAGRSGSAGEPSYARTLPVIHIPAEEYRGVPAYIGERGQAGRPAYVPHASESGLAEQPRFISPTPRAISPTPRAISPTPHAISPTPRAYSPTPRAYSPPPRTYTAPPRMESPHVSAPGGRGR